MKKVMIVTTRPERYSELASSLEKSGRAELVWAREADQALVFAKSDKICFAVVDQDLPSMDGFELVRNLITVDVSIDTAVTSEMSTEQFQESGEGLGIRFQFPARPDSGHADMILEVLRNQIVI